MAGCKRSQSMAEAYTHRAVDELRKSFIVFLPERNTKCEKTPKSRARVREGTPLRGIRVFQHVDDLPQVMWGKRQRRRSQQKLQLCPHMGDIGEGGPTLAV